MIQLDSALLTSIKALTINQTVISDLNNNNKHLKNIYIKKITVILLLLRLYFGKTKCNALKSRKMKIKKWSFFYGII